jgi:hypothetical protein
MSSLQVDQVRMGHYLTDLRGRELGGRTVISCQENVAKLARLINGWFDGVPRECHAYLPGQSSLHNAYHIFLVGGGRVRPEWIPDFVVKIPM